MVFTKFSRIPLQTLSKTFSHGYAQSVVGASQSYYASTTSQLGQLGNYPVAKYARTSQLQNAFQTASSSSSGAKTSHATSANSGGDGGLQAYVAAWQHAQQTGDDSDWRQHQFARRIGWKPAGTQKSSRPSTQKENSSGLDSLRPIRGSAERSYSENTALELRKAEDAAAEAAAVATIDEAITQEIQDIKAARGPPQESSQEVQPSIEAELSQSTESETALTPTSNVSVDTPPSSVSAEETLALSAHIVQLAEQQRYREIPAVFESLQRGGNVPTVEAYNALLIAAIRLPADKNIAFNKALEVYAHLIGRKVIPNHDTHLILIQLFIARALESFSAKQSLESRRKRFGGMDRPGSFLFKTDELEHEAVLQDDSLAAALKQFRIAISAIGGFTLPADLYYTLIQACAQEHLVSDMLEVLGHMEENQIKAHAGMFASMIGAYAMSKDLVSATECFEGYRRLAIHDNTLRIESPQIAPPASYGVLTRTDKDDNDIQAALVKAYLSVDRPTSADRFFGEVMKSYDTAVEEHDARLNDARSTIVLDAYVQHSLDRGAYGQALEHVNSQPLVANARETALARVCIAAADSDQHQIATEAFLSLSQGSQERSLAAGVMVAMHVRLGKAVAAKPYWDIVRYSSTVDASIVDLTTMYAIALIQSGMAEQGLSEAQRMVSRLRGVKNNEEAQAVISEEVDEAIELIGKSVMSLQHPISLSASMSFLRLMVDNSALIHPFAERAIANINAINVSDLTAEDLGVAVQAQTAILLNGPGATQTSDSVRFAHLLSIVCANRVFLDAKTVQMVNEALPRLQQDRQDLVGQWYTYLNPASRTESVASYNSSVAASPAPSSRGTDSSYDPYAHNTDIRGSTIIADILDKMTGNGRNDSHLTEALGRFRQMRRIGRHPRYITYSKLIASAARVGKKDVVHDIFNTACRDVPLLPQNEMVKYGWSSILDAMVSAYLVLGNRDYAAKYHQQLLDLGSAPSANTFGLYITTMKESTKTFDEATEAVKIFHRAIAEGVEPTSFLYNALIGKLGKARRIDDCLQYFAEMRAQNIRPTSVTYGTIVNALCRVSDERFAEEMFDEMESMPNYKPRPAPYNSLIQYFLNTKRDRTKVLAYYKRMKENNIQPTMHTYKLLIDAYASLDPVDMDAAQDILDTIKRTGQRPEAVHYASLIHAKGCVVHDMAGARAVFDSVLSTRQIQPQPCLYQALFESMVANHQVNETGALLRDMASQNVEMTPYIANTLIHGWAAEGNLSNAQSIYDGIGMAKREPSTYEAMTRAFLSNGSHESASQVVSEMLSRGYPSAVSGKVLELMSGGSSAPSPLTA